MKVLALSSSRVGNGGYLADALSIIAQFLANTPVTIGFIPFALVDGNYPDYGQMVTRGLASIPHTLLIATPANAAEVIDQCDVVMVGGGNTFKLLHDIYTYGLFDLIKNKVYQGTPYIGWSAGANITGKTIGTTNDMPIVQPPSFNAFGFLPFQLNPHYKNEVMEGFNGETRNQRIHEYLLYNQHTTVVGLPEGTALQLGNGKITYMGNQPGMQFWVEDKQHLKMKQLQNNAPILW